MSTITGTLAAVEAVATLRDKRAGYPMPYSLEHGGTWINVCPRDHAPLPASWICPTCGETPQQAARDARYTMAAHSDSVRVDDKGVAETTVDEVLATDIATAKAKPAASQSKDEKVLAAVSVKPDDRHIEPAPDPKTKDVTRG